MAWVSRSITVAGLILLAHACYSAQEHAVTASLTKQHSPLHQQSENSLPTDIYLETLVATFVVSLGLVLGTPKLRPIRWNTWAGKIEREGEAGFLDSSGEVEKDFRGNPFASLESRRGFLDIRKQRREFTEWAKGNEK
ncbi:magnesium transporter [Stachybotrys elegans]|uniref:Magnesium transporter n=1 Tax=Stachybotrys elegans TaxID=80388 RepID=A0A8K0WXC3_9HYPO|nr:magnesium transporter [Stachybotrys elegans]